MDFSAYIMRRCDVSPLVAPPPPLLLSWLPFPPPATCTALPWCTASSAGWTRRLPPGGCLRACSANLVLISAALWRADALHVLPVCRHMWHPPLLILSAHNLQLFLPSFRPPSFPPHVLACPPVPPSLSCPPARTAAGSTLDVELREAPLYFQAGMVQSRDRLGQTLHHMVAEEVWLSPPRAPSLPAPSLPHSPPRARPSLLFLRAPPVYFEIMCICKT